MRFARRIFFGCAVVAGLAACDRRPASDAGGRRVDDGQFPKAIPVRVLADSGASVPFAVTPPGDRAEVDRSLAGGRRGANGGPAGAWLVRVSPSGGRVDPPLPAASADTVPPAAPQEGLVVADRLQPPIPRTVATLRVPRGAAGASVELDVLVNRQGFVVDTRWAGGAADTARVRAATECAEAMMFHPALLRGEPVEVWCRQRFDFGSAVTAQP